MDRDQIAGMDNLSLEPRHPIAVVAERTGLSQDVLRVWERRYSAVVPSRGPGGQRLYSDADIERLRLMHTTSRAGRNIGQIAGMTTEALAVLAAEDAAARPPVPEVGDSPRTTELLITALAYAKALDSASLSDELRRASASLGVRKFIEDIAGPLMRRVGDEWHAGGLTVSQEHLATAVLYDLLVDMMRSFANRPGAPRLLVATPAGERHVIGAAIVGASAAADGWNVLYLGADLPAADIADAARESGASAVALSIVYAEERGRLLDEIGRIRQELPREVRLMVGGAGARAMATALRAIGVEVVSQIDRAAVYY